MPLKVAYILEDHVFRRVFSEDLYDIAEERSSDFVFPAELKACFGERLAGKSCAENIVRGYLIWSDRADIPRRLDAEVVSVKMPQFLAYLARENALMPQISQCPVKSTETCEKINESHSVARKN